MKLCFYDLIKFSGLIFEVESDLVPGIGCLVSHPSLPEITYYRVLEIGYEYSDTGLKFVNVFIGEK